MQQHLGGAADLVRGRDLQFRGLARHLGTLAPTRVDTGGVRLSIRNSDRADGWRTPRLLTLFCHGTASDDGPRGPAGTGGRGGRPRPTVERCGPAAPRGRGDLRAPAVTAGLGDHSARWRAPSRARGGGTAWRRMSCTTAAAAGTARRRTPRRDADWAADEAVRRYGDVPVCLVGVDMGARAALHAAGHRAVNSVLALAPWLPEEDVAARPEPVKQLVGPPRPDRARHERRAHRPRAVLPPGRAREEGQPRHLPLRGALRRPRAAPAPRRSPRPGRATSSSARSSAGRSPARCRTRSPRRRRWGCGCRWRSGFGRSLGR